MTERVYPDNHPFSPHYVGRVAAEKMKPRYPNRVQPPKPETKRKLQAVSQKGKSLRPL
jgi:hypothetical protein